MKRTGKCPKCGGSDIIADAQPIDRGDNNWHHKLSLATFESPEALIFKGKRETTMSAWVCAECGYVELYADSPQSLLSPDS